MIGKIALSLVLCMVPFSFAQNSIFENERQHIRSLAMQLYANLHFSENAEPSPLEPVFDAIASRDWRDENKLFNSIVFLIDQYQFGKNSPKHATYGVPRNVQLKKQFNWLLDNQKIPSFNDEMVARQVTAIYRYLNPGHLSSLDRLAGEDVIDLMAFLTIADRMDAKLDANLTAAEIHVFYNMLVTKKVPLSAIGYHCRVNQTWTDRRTLIGGEEIKQHIPRKIRRLKHADISNDAKIDRIIDFVQSVVSPEKDGWSSDFWQTPFETKILGRGDCEDFAILFQAIAEYVGLRSKLIVGKIPLDGDTRKMTNHAWNQVGGRTIDAIRDTHDFSGYIGKIQMDSHNSSFIYENLESTPRFENHFLAKK